MKTLSDTRQASQGRRYSNVLRLASNVADGELITIGSEVYEIDTAADPGAITAGNIRVNCFAGVTPTIASAALVAAVNANTQQGILAVAISVNEVFIATRKGSPARQLACAETLAGANNAWAAASMYGGSEAFRGVQMQERAANAQEVALGSMRFVFPFNPVAALAVVRTSAGVVKAWDGARTITGDRVDIDNAGTTDWAAGDLVTIMASE